MGFLARALAVSVVVVTAAAAGEARAQSTPAAIGWTPLADVAVGDLCARKACVAELPVSWRSATYAVATDAALGVTLTGHIAFVCADATERKIFLPSPQPGAIATIANPCPAAVKRARVVVESASVPGGERRGATLRVLGSIL